MVLKLVRLLGVRWESERRELQWVEVWVLVRV